MMSFLWGGSNKCENCKDKPKFGSYDYCGKGCADEAEAKKRSLTEEKRKLGGGGGSKNRNDGDDNLCEECHIRPKNKQRDDFTRNIVVHPFCGRSCKDANTRRRAEAARQTQMQHQQQLASGALSSQVGMAGGMRESVQLKRFNPKDPLGKTVFQRFIEQWKSDVGPPTVVAICRILMPQKYTTRFIDTLDTYDGCSTSATYYGGQCLCEVGANPDEFAVPCDWRGCSICVVMKFGFDRLEFGETAYDGLYGRGIYTHLNSSNAHRFTVGKSTSQFRAIIQCRVAHYDTRDHEGVTDTAMIDAEGRVYCDENSKSAIVPTHLIVYGMPKTSHPARKYDDDYD